MYESYGTYVTHEYVDNHDNDDDTDDDNDHKKDSYTAAGAAPTRTRPGHARPGQAKPSQAKPDPKNTLFLHEMGFSAGKVIMPSLRSIFRALSI